MRRISFVRGAVVALALAMLAGGPAAAQSAAAEPGRVYFESWDTTSGYATPVEIDIFSVAADGSDLQQLTEGEGYNYAVRVSPDGSQLAFASNRAGSYDVWVMDADGSDPRRITTGTGPERYPVWSPDSDAIAYSDAIGIVIAPLDGGPSRRVMRGTTYGYDWHPTEDRIVFERYPDQTSSSLHIVDFGDDLAEPVVTDLVTDDYAYGPRWSPDGERIAFRTGMPACVSCPKAIETIHADGSGRRPVDTGVLPASGPDWSPDGAHLVFAGHVQAVYDVEVDLYTVPVDGGTPQLLVLNPGSADYFPSWG